MYPPKTMCGNSKHISIIINEAYVVVRDDRDGRSVNRISAVNAIKRLCTMFAYFFLHGRTMANNRDPATQTTCAGEVANFTLMCNCSCKMTIELSKIKWTAEKDL